ncbi:MAG: response regulator [Deltaproteobacteria bacterium]|nr:response regulator [Deltaproteobacteria bacterium]
MCPLRRRLFLLAAAALLPLALVDAAVWRSALFFGGGFPASIVIGVIAASVVGRSIAARPRRGGAAGRDVLVVEDDDDAREALCELLTLAGHRVRSAADGVAGLAALVDAPPDVALVDVGLPGIDGYEVARRARAAGAAARTKLVALTGYGLPEDQARAIEAGFHAHLVKPVSLDALAKLLAE